jgi:uncharacterized repeat protein (TIGR01451 family)
MRVFYGRVALATVLASMGISVATAQTLELAAEQPTVIGTASQAGLEGQLKAGEAVGDTAVYIVQLTDAAMATYNGGMTGYAATSNRMTGDTTLDVNSQASVAYGSYLEGAQDKLIAHCEAGLGHAINVPYKYQTVLNAVAMTLTADEANLVAQIAGVKSISRERMEVLMTDAGPAWINAPSIWGNGNGNHYGWRNNGNKKSMGEGAVVAILDSGINSDHPSFADIGGDGYDHTNPLGSGNYLPGSHCDVVDASFCNDKLIGAWDMTGPADGDTPEDTDGHGSHTASTAAGNVVLGAALGAPTTVLTRDVSGVAAHANIIAYDVCIDTCPGSALLAAIEQVVIDASNLPNGIDSLNYSISGGADPYNNTIELGFLNATAAGVYVSASAGNSGPTASTVAHLGPWVSTTAALTHDRLIQNQVVGLGSDGDALADIAGLGLTSGYGPATIINSADLEADFPGSTLCGTGVIGDLAPPWPPGTFNGEIVACTRGTFGRVEKGANVMAAGAGGYILMDNGSGLVADSHVLPGVHISLENGAVLAAWLAANDNTMGAISGFDVVSDASAGDIMAGFSSRGPNLEIDVLKPDLGAPGSSIFAAEANGQAPIAPEYQFLSGTSMSSPHNAGSGALVSRVKPDWSPYEIRSAIMMTAETNALLKEDGITPVDAFDSGAGRIDLEHVQKAGLVLDETPANFLASNPAIGGDPSTLNLASMKNSVCVGECSWTRTVENVTGNTAHWSVDTSGPEGLGLSVDPGQELRMSKGQSKDITVTADTSLAEPGWNFGTLELGRSSGPDLHMPIAVFAANSSNPSFLTKTVDAAIVAEDEPLNYEISITNGPVTGQIDLVDVLPDGLEFVDGSENTVLVNGTESVPLSHNGGQLTWSGELDPGGLQVTASPAPFGYFSLGAFGVTPRNAAGGLPGNCDDGAFLFNIPAFDYNGASYSQVIWSMNGTIEAGTASGSATSFANQNLPDPIAPNNILAPYWRDLNPCAGGNLYVAVLGTGVQTWTIFEWEDVPHFGSSDSVTFQIWLEAGAESIHYTYARLDAVNDGTVGAENADGTNGTSYYFDGAGTSPVVGTDLLVSTQEGGSATFGFQAEVKRCDDSIVNRVSLTGATEETAIAVTECAN